MCVCGDTYTKLIYSVGHMDNDEDGRCDECQMSIENDSEEDNAPSCACICHEDGITSILYKLLSLIQRYFKVDLLGKVLKMEQTCSCGMSHY